MGRNRRSHEEEWDYIADTCKELQQEMLVFLAAGFRSWDF